MRNWVLVAVIASIAFAQDQVGEKRRAVYVRDLLTDRPVTGVEVTIEVGRTTETATTGARGELMLPADRKVTVQSKDARWRILPRRFRVDEDRIEVAAHRFITVRGTLSGQDIEHIEDGNIYATLVDPEGKDPGVGGGVAPLEPLGLRPMWRAGIPDRSGRFEFQVPRIRGIAIFARHGVQFASIRRLALKETVEVGLTLQSGIRIAGKLVDEDGKRVRGTEVRAVVYTGGRAGRIPERELLRRMGDSARINIRIPDGRFVYAHKWFYDRNVSLGSFDLTTCSDGLHRVFAFAPGFLRYDSGPLVLSGSRTDYEIKLERAVGRKPVRVTIGDRRIPNREVKVTEYVSPEEHYPTGGRFLVYRLKLDEESRMPTEWFREGISYLLAPAESRGLGKKVRWPFGESIDLEGAGERLLPDGVKVEVELR
ncbi:MAG: hypothetical protein AAGD14_13250 [Planctomycetota bacterium]